MPQNMSILQSNNFVRILAYTVIISTLILFLTPNLFAVTDADFKDELAKGEKLIGHYLRLSLIAIVGIAAGMSILKHNWLLLGLSTVALLFVSLMRNWITTNFAATI